MGRKQHQSDKLWLTTQEMKYFFGGYKGARRIDPEEVDYKRLPFDHCALSLQPFENPYCDEEGNVFDLVHIVPFIKKYKMNPCNGKPLDAKGLVKMKFFKNAAGEYHCPVMYKPYNNSTHIAVIKTTGHVFSYEAIEELNLKTKNFKDLLTDTVFVRSDIIVIQDPRNTTKFNLTTFHHLIKDLKVEDEEDVKRAKTDPRARIKKANPETSQTLAELDATYQPDLTTDIHPDKAKVVVKADKFNAATWSTGMRGASLTSTAFARVMEMDHAILDESAVKYARVKKKGYVRLQTNQGPINLELHCEIAKKTCDNFLKLCQSGYYTGTIFHRSIRHFCIQGGDPEGTGKGGQSVWGAPFKDEFYQQLSHAGRGILAMANSGPDSNKSQFYITYRSAKHLDSKHTVFGKLVGGMETLDAMERIGTDNKDAPVEEIKIEKVSVFVDPFLEIEEELAEQRAKELAAAAEELKSLPKPVEKKQKAYTSGVGKYINPAVKKEAKRAVEEQAGPSKKKPKSGSYGFKDFSAW